MRPARPRRGTLDHLAPPLAHARRPRAPRPRLSRPRRGPIARAPGPPLRPGPRTRSPTGRAHPAHRLAPRRARTPPPSACSRSPRGSAPSASRPPRSRPSRRRTPGSALAASPRRAARSSTCRAWTRVDGFRSAGGTHGRGLIVGVVDTGLDVPHPDFRNADGPHPGRLDAGRRPARGAPPRPRGEVRLHRPQAVPVRGLRAPPTSTR